MKRSITVAASAIAVAILLLPAPAPAADHGDVARVTYWTIRDGQEDDFEAGLKAHNAIHAEHNDPNALLTWQIITGKRNGQYLRGSFDHAWADFDVENEMTPADEADSAVNVDPYIAKAEPKIAVALPELTNPGSGPPFALSRVIYFHVRPGKQQQFEGVVGKIHAALSEVEGGWPAYFWFRLVDGGSLPTYVVSLGRQNWAGFAPHDPTFEAAVAAKYGEDTAKIFGALSEVIEHQHSYTSVFRADLSYIPASD